MRVGIYARVSTSDKDQDPQNQLGPLLEFTEAQGWKVYGVFVDHFSATDLARRVQWAQMLEDASKRRFDLLLVWRLDRAFRSVLDAANTLERLRAWGVGLRSYTESWLDTTTPFGEALYYITAAYAQLERGILAERVKAGMDRARKQGVQIGRPRVTERPGFNNRFGGVLARVEAGELTRSEAAQELGIGYATFKRLLDQLAEPAPTEAG